ncbi:DUF4174 domain-containing protein [Psychromarinibacter halotolerans]|uniref:DUF4174 domain-containing protein n=1 Tax=Psychromarinibacter halotolerans TaxID=1775175 RepID=A0ABV7GQZ8_9RHOB|nr:DUF4174 domain-containing protein [Psychromarinibacter halotolerans]MDF0596668.1 DUF4174 domain-containing protein [Psychromarinibacter halotolerans]
MAKVLTSIFIVCVSAAAWAQDAEVVSDTGTAEAEREMAEEVPLFFEASEVTLDEFVWTKRVVVVFADTPADPRYIEQLELLSARPEALIARDVIVITDSDPSAETDVRRALRPRGFQLTLIEKDGRVNLRKPLPWDVREVTRAIDKWPLRQEEIREGRGTE